MTQYVYINSTVTFECATNLTGYDIYIITRGAQPSSQTFASLPNGGEMISFNLTATNQSNGTDVTCYTLFNGNATETAYLYVQGQSIHIYHLCLSCLYMYSQVVLIVSVI